MWKVGDEENFDQRVLRTNNHWLWVGYVSPKDGYGRWKPRHNDLAQLAHRAAYERWVGPISDDYVIDHINHPDQYRRCVRPDHLEAITHAENTRRGDSPAGVNSRLTHCPRCGDPLEPPYCTLRKDGSRRCLRCQRAEHARYRARKRAVLSGQDQAVAGPDG